MKKIKRTIAVLLTICLIVNIFYEALPKATAVIDKEISFYYNGFYTSRAANVPYITSDLNLQGGSGLSGTNIFMQTAYNTNRLATQKQKFSLPDDYSFSTYFKIVTGDGASPHGGGNAQGGYVRFSIDTTPNYGTSYSSSDKYFTLGFDNLGAGGGYSNDAAILINSGNIVQATINNSANKFYTPVYIGNNTTYYVWIDYNGSTNQMEVRMANTDDRPVSATRTQTVDLKASFGEQDGLYMGFNGWASDYLTYTYVGKWYFNNHYEPIDIKAYNYDVGAYSTTITRTSADAYQETHNLKVETKDSFGAVMPNREVTLTTDKGKFSNGTKSITVTTDTNGIATLDISQNKATEIATIKAEDIRGTFSTTTAKLLYTPVIGLALNKATTSIPVNSDELLTPTVTPTNATDKTVTWTSSDTNVATVDSTGKVTAKSVGTAKIKATSNDINTIYAETDVTTFWQPVTGVTLNKNTLALTKTGTAEGTETLIATVIPADASNKTVNWTSDNSAVATVDQNGLVTAKGGGNATIRATTVDQNKVATATVTVTEHPTGVVIKDSSSNILDTTNKLQIKMGSTATVTGEVVPPTSTNKNVFWSVANAAILSIDSTGAITPKAIGETTITVTSVDGGHTSTAGVIVKHKDALLANVKIHSNNTFNPAYVRPGDTGTITFSSEQPLGETPVVKIKGKYVDKSLTVINTSGNNYSASHTFDAIEDKEGIVEFTIDYKNQDLVSAPTVTSTSDGSSIRFKLPNPNNILPQDMWKNGNVSININSSGEATNQVWIAPEGTANFVVGSTMTKAANGVATTIMTPATEGIYRVYVLDVAGNIAGPSTHTLVVDDTPPVIIGAENNKIYKVNKVISYYDVNLDTATVYENNTKFELEFLGDLKTKSDGVYRIIVRDKAGNTSELNFTVDKTPPIVIGVTDSGKYKDSRTITFNEGTAKITKDGGAEVAFTSGSTITEDGVYILTVEDEISDEQGNQTIVNFTIDTTPPIVEGVSEGNTYNVPVTVTFNEGNASLSKNSGAPVSFTSGYTINEDATYLLVVTDDIGNKTTVNFTIDQTAPNPPILTLTPDVAYTNQNVSIEISGTAGISLYYRVNSDAEVAYTGVFELKDDGTYSITAKATDGSTGKSSYTLKTIIIDKIAPVVSNVSEGGFYNAAKTIQFNEGTATLNGNPFMNGATLTASGAYTLVVTDKAGNVTTVQFTMDTDLPVIEGVSDNGIYNSDRTITYTDNSPVSAKLNGTSFASGGTVSSEGNHLLIVKDSAGNEVLLTFKIDKTPPIVIGVSDGGVYSSERTITFNDGTATIDGNPFANGSTFSTQGAHILVVTDDAGNQTTINFTMDTSVPLDPIIEVNPDKQYSNTNVTVEIYQDALTKTSTDKIVYSINGGTDVDYTSPIYLTNEDTYAIKAKAINTTTLKESVATRTVVIDKTFPIISNVIDHGIYKVNVIPTFNEGNGKFHNMDFISGTTISEEGTHQLTVTDQAGNSSEVMFTIDKTAPVVDGVVNNGHYKVDKQITFNEGTATLNGAAFTSGYTVTTERAHTLIVTDDAGNKTTVIFTIDKTAPIVSGVVDGEVTKNDKTITFNEGTATLDGVAFTNGSTVNTVGKHKLIVTDKAGNITSVDFEIDRTVPDSPVISSNPDKLYSNDKFTVTITVPSSTDPTTINTYYKVNTDVNFYTYATPFELNNEGEYTITSSAMNKSTLKQSISYRTFIIDKTAPVVYGVSNGGNYGGTKVITVSDANPVTMKLDGIDFTNGDSVSTGGSHVIVATDAAGNVTTVNFTINSDMPIVTGVHEGKIYNIDRTITFDKGTATLNGAPFTSGYVVSTEGSYILRAVNGTADPVVINFAIDKTPPIVSGVTNGEATTSDKTITFDEGTATLNGQPFTNGTTINQEGQYYLRVIDDANNITTVSFIICKTPPIISGVQEGYYYNTNRAITYNKGTATLNGLPFTSGSTVTAEGQYTIIAKNFAGQETTVNFTIDKTAPVITGVSDGVTRNNPVDVSFNEGMATLDGKPFINGSRISKDGEHTLIVQDAATNKTTVKFTINKDVPGSAIIMVSPNKTLNNDKFTVTISMPSGNPDYKLYYMLTGAQQKSLMEYSAPFEITAEGLTTITAKVEDPIDYKSSLETLTVTIDKTPPIVTGVENGKSYSESKTINYNEGTAKLNGVAFVEGTAVSDLGDYTLEVIDQAGNKTVINFKIVPQQSSGGGSNGGGSNGGGSNGGGSSTTAPTAGNVVTELKYVVIGNKEIPAKIDEVMKPFVTGYTDGTFKPKKTMIRSELAAIMIRAMELETNNSINTSFADVKDGYWAKSYISKTIETGLFKGYPDGKFRPDGQLTRAQFAKVLANYLDYSKKNVKLTEKAPFKDIGNSWAKDAIIKLYNYGGIRGYEDGTFRPNQQITREEAMAIINRTFRFITLPNVNPTFTDVPQTTWSFGDIEAAARTYRMFYDDNNNLRVVEVVYESK